MSVTSFLLVELCFLRHLAEEELQYYHNNQEFVGELSLLHEGSIRMCRKYNFHSDENSLPSTE